MIYIHIYIYMYIYIHIYISLMTYIFIYIMSDMRACLNIYMYVCANVWIYISHDIYIHIHLYIYTGLITDMRAAGLHKFVYIFTHVCINIKFIYTYIYVYIYRSYHRHARSRPPARCRYYRGPFPVARRWMSHELTYDESRTHSLSLCRHYSRCFSSQKWRNKSRNYIWLVTNSHMMSHALTLSDGSVAVIFRQGEWKRRKSKRFGD